MSHRKAYTRVYTTVIHTQGDIYTRIYTTYLHTLGGIYPGIYTCYTHPGRHILRFIPYYTHPERHIPRFIPYYTPWEAYTRVYTPYIHLRGIYPGLYLPDTLRRKEASQVLRRLSGPSHSWHFWGLFPLFLPFWPFCQELSVQAALRRRPEAPLTRFTVGWCWFLEQLLLFLTVLCRNVLLPRAIPGRLGGPENGWLLSFLLVSAPFSHFWAEMAFKPVGSLSGCPPVSLLVFPGLPSRMREYHPFHCWWE